MPSYIFYLQIRGHKSNGILATAWRVPAGSTFVIALRGETWPGLKTRPDWSREPGRQRLDVSISRGKGRSKNNLFLFFIVPEHVSELFLFLMHVPSVTTSPGCKSNNSSTLVQSVEVLISHCLI